MVCKLCDGLLEKKGKQAVDALERHYSKQERERIIKLLEWELWEAFQKSHNEQPAWATMGMLVRAIKEESK